MSRPLAAACLGTLLSTSTVGAQMFLGAPAGAMPLVPAPAARPVHDTSDLDPGTPARNEMALPRDPATDGPQVSGRDLARRVEAVTQLEWLDSLDEARLESAATGKPVLWLQGLGDLDGFA